MKFLLISVLAALAFTGCAKFSKTNPETMATNDAYAPVVRAPSSATGDCYKLKERTSFKMGWTRVVPAEKICMEYKGKIKANGYTSMSVHFATAHENTTYKGLLEIYSPTEGRFTIHNGDPEPPQFDVRLVDARVSKKGVRLTEIQSNRSAGHWVELTK